jgi:signal transduction histidine kinase
MPELQADRSSLMHRWSWAIGAGAVLALIILLVLVAPGSMALYETYWGKESIRGLFYEDLGFSYSWSSFIAIVGSFFYGLAWVPLTAWTARVLVWRFNTRQLATAFGCWALVYGHVPLLEAILGSDTCFNQRTGVALKWYVEDPNGQITLFDSAGFDTVTRAEKQPVTPDVCRAFAQQKIKEQPRRITASLKDVEFFDPNSGRAKVWYSKAADGSFALYDRSGFDPLTSDPLHPVTKDIVAGLMAADLARQRAEQAAAEAEEARRQAEANAQQKAVEAQQLADEARRRLAEAEPSKQYPVAAPAPGSVSQNCPGHASTVTIGLNPTVINANLCQVRGYVIDGCASWFNTQGQFLARSCVGDIPSDPPGIYSVKGEPKVVVRLNYCAPFANGNNLEVCGF